MSKVISHHQDIEHHFIVELESDTDSEIRLPVRRDSIFERGTIGRNGVRLENKKEWQFDRKSNSILIAAPKANDKISIKIRESRNDYGCLDHVEELTKPRPCPICDNDAYEATVVELRESESARKQEVELREELMEKLIVLIEATGHPTITRAIRQIRAWRSAMPPQ